MRLTLRTLLAYLDDTLDPSEIKEIGQKVADSEQAQELIARIKQVTRRRRLTTPPLTGGKGSIDPNAVAEYLDNTLASEQLAEVEQTALSSDVHLAEIAACHQILTLVVGEPALVPPTAKQRFYGLVHGKESSPSRKATKPASASGATSALPREQEGDETLLMGLPLFRQAPWLRWALPVAAVVLLTVMGLALWSALPRHQSELANRDNTGTKDKVASLDKATGQDKTGATGKTGVGETDKTTPPKDKSATDKTPTDKDKTSPRDKPSTDKGPENGGSGGLQETPLPPREPSMERRETARFVSKGQVLVRHPGGSDLWERLAPESPVFTAESLVSLPGYQSELRTSGNVDVLLWGNVPEVVNGGPLESAITLHYNPLLDLEFTLDRGRVYLTSRKEKTAKVRLRFGTGEVWDLDLEPGAVIALQMTREYTYEFQYQPGLAPYMELDFLVVKGEAAVTMGHLFLGDLQPSSHRNRMTWNNKGRAPRPYYAETEPPELSTKPTDPKKATEVKVPLEELAMRLAKNDKMVASNLEEAVESGRALEGVLAVRGLGAIGAIPKVIDILGNPKLAQGARHEAIFVLRAWIGRGTVYDKQLYDPEKKDGWLIKKDYDPIDAKAVFDLLHAFYYLDAQSQPEVIDALINYLRHPKLAVRELAFWHLLRSPAGRVQLNYNATWDQERRDKAVDEMRRLRRENKLPPMRP